MEDFSSLKRNEIMIHTMIWINLKNTINERSQTHTLHCVCFNLNELSRIDKSIRTDSRPVAARAASSEQ